MPHEGRLLMVEDDKKWENELRGLLSDRPYKMMMAQTLPQARGLLKDHVFDVVLLDLRLKDWEDSNFDGWRLLEDLRPATEEQGTQVIIVTAYGTIEHVRDAFKKHQIVDFFQKQHLAEREDEFRQAVATAVDRAYSVRDSILAAKYPAKKKK
ncbi:MAG TPA: response regulator [Anaerolineae bacterium]|nr:response regulator [Anaerolineae bacterium]